VEEFEGRVVEFGVEGLTGCPEALGVAGSSEWEDTELWLEGVEVSACGMGAKGLMAKEAEGVWVPGSKDAEGV